MTLTRTLPSPGTRPAAVSAALVRAGTALVLATILVFSGMLMVPFRAAAVPGTPGVPQPASPVYAEDFQNQTAATAIRVNQYTGGPAANNSTYLASTNWAPAGRQCNGWILRSSTPLNSAVTNVDSGCEPTAWSYLQGMGTAIGLYRGETLATAQQNQFLSQYTNGGVAPGPGVQLQTAEPITATIIPGHFYQISAIYGAANCVSEGPGAGRQDPSLSFNLIQNQTGSGPPPGTGSGTLTTLASGLNPCTDPSAQIIRTGGHAYHVARLNSTGFRMPSGVNSLGIQLFNASGDYRGNDSGFDDPVIVDATPQLDKTFSPATLQAGQTTTLTLTITNTTDLAAKNGWSFTDTLPEGLSLTGPVTTDCPAGASSISGRQISGSGNLTTGTVSCSFNVPVTSDTAATYTNGPANLGPIDGLLLPGESTVEFTTADARSIDLIKSADLTDPSQYVVGAPVTYSFLVTNTGNVPLTGVSVTDTAFSGTGTPPVVSCPASTLSAGAAFTCTASYTLTQPDIDAGQVTNSAEASGIPPSGVAVTDTASALIAGTIAPALDLIKTADSSGVQSPARAGDVINYNFTVTNTGNVDLVDVAVTDELSGLGTIAYTWPGMAGSLAPGQSATATAGYVVQQGDVDAGQVTNLATANGTAPGAPPVASSPETTATPLVPGPELLLDKTAAADFGTPALPGDLITYRYTVTNTGNVTLANVSVTDLLPGLSPATYAWPGAAGVLAPGQTVTAAATYPITQADIDAAAVTNSATASGTTPAGAQTPSNQAGTVTPIVRAPLIALTKTANSPGVEDPPRPGNPITYTFTVTNAGNTTLSGVAISDRLPGLSSLTYVWPGADGVLMPGQSATATAGYLVTQADIIAGNVTNSAVASGTAPDNTPVESAPESTVVPLGAAPSLALTKSATPMDQDGYLAGVVVTYSYVVTNTGNVPLDDIEIAETGFTGTGPVPAAVCPQGTLPAAGQVTCTATYVLTQADVDAGQLTNTATPTGIPPAGPPVSSNESSTVIPEGLVPALSLAKTADQTEVTAPGQVIRYTFVLTNTGNVSLRDTAVTETGFSGAGTLEQPRCAEPDAVLLPGASATCTALYTVVAADLTGAPLSNTAAASATGPGGVPVLAPPASAGVSTVPAPVPLPPPAESGVPGSPGQVPPVAGGSHGGLPSTGATFAGTGSRAAALLLAAGILMVAGSRLRAGHRA